MLSKKVNRIERQWKLGSYCYLSKPLELTNCHQNPVARDRIELPTPCFSDMGKPFKPIPF